MAIICLKTCNDVFEANLIKTQLTDAGINCFLTNENFSNLYPGFNGMMGAGVRVMIDEQDLDAAVTLLEQQNPHAIQCPHCSSKDIRLGLGYKKFGKLLVILLSLISWMPFNNLKLVYQCKNCKAEFRK